MRFKIRDFLFKYARALTLSKRIKNLLFSINLLNFRIRFFFFSKQKREREREKFELFNNSFVWRSHFER